MTARARALLPSDPLSLALVAGVAVWTVVMPGALLGVLPPIPLYLELLFGVPLCLTVARLLTWAPSVPIGSLAAWSAMVTGAIVGSYVVAVYPLVVVGLPVLAVAVVVLARRPVLSFSVLFLFTGTFGSLTAFADVPVGPMADVLLLSLLAAAAIAHLQGGSRMPIRAWPGTAVLAAYVGITAFSSIAAARPDLGLHSFRASTWYLLAALVVGYHVWRRGATERLFKAVLAVAALVGGYALLRWQIGPAPSEWTLAISSASIYNFVEGKLRLFGSFSSGHELAAWCSAIVPACCAYALTLRGRWALVGAFAGGACTLAVLASEVRIGLVAVAVGLTVVLVLYQLARGFEGLHLGTTTLFVAGAMILSVTAFSVTVGGDDVREQRFANILTPDRDPAYQARVVKWESAMADLAGKPLGHGIGSAGRVQQRSQRYVTVASVNVDNGYLKVAWEQGYAIAAMFAAGALMLLVGLGRRAIFAPDRLRAGAGIGAAGALASYLVLLFAGVYNEGLTALAAWLIVGLGIAQFARGRPRGECG